MFPKIYISNTENTKAYAEQVLSRLTDAGYPVWAGFKDLHPGQRWKDRLEEAVKDALIFIVFVGPLGQMTSLLDAEWQAIIEATWTNADDIVIPVLVKDAEPAPFLRSWVPLRIDPDSETNWMERLLTAIEQCQSRSAIAMRDEVLERQRTELRQRLDQNRQAVRAMQELQGSQRTA